MIIYKIIASAFAFVAFLLFVRLYRIQHALQEGEKFIQEQQKVIDHYQSMLDPYEYKIASREKEISDLRKKCLDRELSIKEQYETIKKYQKMLDQYEGKVVSLENALNALHQKHLVSTPPSDTIAQYQATLKRKQAEIEILTARQRALLQQTQARDAEPAAFDVVLASYEVLLKKKEEVFNLYIKICAQIDYLNRLKNPQPHGLDDKTKTIHQRSWLGEEPIPEISSAESFEDQAVAKQAETVDVALTILSHSLEEMNYVYVDELKNLVAAVAANGVISHESFLVLRTFCLEHDISKPQFIKVIHDVAKKLGIHFHVQTMPQDLSPKERGDKFEAFVTTLFKKRYFSLLEWRGDKRSPHGQLPESSMNPDLEYAFKLGKNEARFAVECKWRDRFMEDGTLQWSYPEQVARYFAFAKERRVPVFVVLGVGGMPQDPQLLYVVPLDQMPSAVVTRAQLAPYFKGSRSQFYFDLKAQTLR